MSEAVDVIGDVLHLYGSSSFTSGELMAELEHYARIMRAEVPHSTAVGKRLKALGYKASDTRKRDANGKKVTTYKHNLRAIKRA